MRHQHSALLALLALTACGRVTEVTVPQVSPDSRTPTRARPSTGVVDTPVCFDVDGTAAPALAWVQDGAIFLQDSTGDRQTLATFAPDAEGRKPSVGVHAHLGHLLVTVTRYGEAASWEARAYSRRGEARWIAEGEGYLQSEVFVAEDGAAAFSFRENDRWHLQTVRADGRQARFDDLMATGKPLGPVAPARRVGTGGQPDSGWVNLDTGDFVPVTPPGGGVYPTYVPGRFAWADTTGAVPAFVVATPKVTTRHPLEVDPTWLSQATLSVDADRAVFFVDPWDAPAELLAVDLATGRSQHLTLPEGTSPFGYHTYFGPTLDDEGGALLPLRDDYVGGLSRFDAETGTWSPLTLTHRDITTMEFQQAAGTYVVWAMDYLGYFPMDHWAELTDDLPAEKTADLVGPAVQVIRPGEDILHLREVEPETYAASSVLSEDGLCVAFVHRDYSETAETTTLTLLDVRSGAESILELEGPVTGPVWLR